LGKNWDFCHFGIKLFEHDPSGRTHNNSIIDKRIDVSLTYLASLIQMNCVILSF
jgi:hypothetical protein